MMDYAIPDYDIETAALSRIGTAGFVVGFGLRFGQPDYFLNSYPSKWTDFYESENYFFGDPVVAWTISRIGATRWSDIAFPDIRGILDQAARFGMRYGATAVTKLGRKRSFISVARPDREVTDAELAYLLGRIDMWARLFAKSQVALTEPELEVLRMLRDGVTQGQAAENLGIHLSTLKLRINSAQRKLGTNRTSNAIALAVRQQLI